MTTLRFTNPDTLQRSWGSEQIVVWTATHAGKILRRRAGTKGGFQCHVKEESHYVYVGELLIEYVQDGQIKKAVAKDGQAWTVPPFTFHRETALTDCILFEVSDPTSDDRYGLVKDALPNMTDDQAVQKLLALADQHERKARACHKQAVTVKREGLKALAPKVAVDA